MSQLRLGLDEEELALLIGLNPSLPESIKISKEDLDLLKKGVISLGLMGKAKRALAFGTARVTVSQTDFMLKEEKFLLATRNEVLALEASVEGLAHMVLGLFEALKEKGIISQDDLHAALKKTADGRIESEK